MTSIANSETGLSVRDKINALFAAFEQGGLGRNRIINGGMRVDQRNAGASLTLTAGAALAYSMDRWYAYCTGANASVQRVALSNAQNRLRFTGAASVTGVGLGQRIEADNSLDLAGSDATLQLKASSSSLTTLNWALYYASTSDTFGTLASPTRTLIASGSFTINSTEALYSTVIAIPSGATTGLELVLTGGALGATQTLTIGDVQLERGAKATTFERRSIGQETDLCQRYFQRHFDPPVRGVCIGTTQMNTMSMAIKPMRVAPAVSISGTLSIYDGTNTGTITALAASNSTAQGFEFNCVRATATGSFVAGRPGIVYVNGSAGSILLNAEL